MKRQLKTSCQMAKCHLQAIWKPSPTVVSDWHSRWLGKNRKERRNQKTRPPSLVFFGKCFLFQFQFFFSHTISEPFYVCQTCIQQAIEIQHKKHQVKHGAFGFWCFEFCIVTNRVMGKIHPSNFRRKVVWGLKLARMSKKIPERIDARLSGLEFQKWKNKYLSQWKKTWASQESWWLDWSRWICSSHLMQILLMFARIFWERPGCVTRFRGILILRIGVIKIIRSFFWGRYQTWFLKEMLCIYYTHRIHRIDMFPLSCIISIYGKN